MNKRELEAQADRLELVLHDHKTPARVTGGTVTPRWIQFLLQTTPGIKINKIEALTREIALALGVSDARVTTQNGAVRIDVPRPDPRPVKFLTLYTHLPHRSIPFGSALLGLADDGAPLLVRLPSPAVGHVLIAGTTGSGKTALLRSIVVSLLMRYRRSEVQLLVIDPTGHAFAALSEAPHLLQPIVAQPDRAVATLADLTRLLDARAKQRLEVDRALHIRTQLSAIKPRIVVVIDELADLVQTGSPRVLDHLGRLVQRGREVGIHVVAATQKPSSSIIGPLVKANFPLRLVGRVVCAEDARVAAGIGGSGAEHLNGQGDFVAITSGGVMRFQAAYLSDDELLRVAENLSGRGTAGQLPAGTLRHQDSFAA
jgi:S-DNA-T family DNA segregation ATPase FtsK/SpoIIIE